jgi:hypothetical protein
MGQRARQTAESQIPSWEQVLEEDLVPVWRQNALSTGNKHTAVNNPLAES